MKQRTRTPTAADKTAQEWNGRARRRRAQEDPDIALYRSSCNHDPALLGVLQGARKPALWEVERDSSGW